MKLKGIMVDPNWVDPRRKSWEESGIYYGYPQCCITAFTSHWCGETKEKYPEGPWIGTGYVPCADCADKAIVDFARFVAEHITPNRQCRFVFPSDDMGPLPEIGNDH